MLQITNLKLCAKFVILQAVRFYVNLFQNDNAIVSSTKSMFYHLSQKLSVHHYLVHTTQLIALLLIQGGQGRPASTG